MAKRSSEKVEIVGLDLGDRYTSWCLCRVGGEVISEGRVRTTAEALSRQFGDAPRRRIVLETGTHSLWIARLLRAMGHVVFVLHARSLRLITASRRKTDRLDARVLAQLGATTSVEVLHTVDVIDESVQADRAVLLARDLLVRARTQQVAHVRGVAKAWGVRLSSATTKSFPGKVREQIPQALRPALTPILDSILRLCEAIAAYDEQLEKLAEESYPHSRLLTQVPGVGTLSALAYLWTIRDPKRFAKSRQVGAYVGLTAASRASGQRDPQLRITKQGNPLLRRLLVQCAHHILSRNKGDSDLQRFGLRIAAQGGRRGKKRAVVAVARKLAVLLHHLWKTGEVYTPNFGGDSVLKKAA